MENPPDLPGVQHRYLDLGDGVTIHVAEAGPEDGPPVMLVHGFPQNWWEWRRHIEPLAADGYRVLCPDLRGAGWSSTPPGDHYFKNDLADDLAGVVDRLGVGPVRLVAHDWGGPVATIFMLRHPEKVVSFMGINTAVPWLKRDLTALANIWRMWYQIPMLLPVIGPRVIADPKMRFFRLLGSWVGGDFVTPEEDMEFYRACMSRPAYALAGSKWYRTFQTREAARWMRGEYDRYHVTVPVRWLHGTEDSVLTPELLRVLPEHCSNFDLELVPGAGHWIIEERPELVLDRLRTFLTLGADAGKSA
ncbi:MULTISPECIES: alpha/beta fold hydrolase [Mycobacteriaceae]|jgi:pimeloyl-ACP methyl ester carboxylesterase|uniref:Pimeloyl-ACP methyl ester carboxylesterase n=1 Tax=Mycolicibacterium fluoranthenivorans TaxID=258505 RepID=A0A1G4W5C6_9MYCO|nr:MULTISPECIES: alpha/beta hydrolase [Mycobacteriaceae]MCV7251544.1 alpha/beta hydrolase [Mycobacterium hackensackense]SCX17026.1 Pimeloyl-ACP methyl ester carboxylesterase [Mycolicibacterium fluoranthenivorans]